MVGEGLEEKPGLSLIDRAALDMGVLEDSDEEEPKGGKKRKMKVNYTR